MDGAWALYEAWVKLQLGELDTALVYCYGKSAPGPIHEVLSRQLDPYHVAPLWPDAISLAALQARAYLESGKATEADFAEVATRSRRNALVEPVRPAGLGPLGRGAPRVAARRGPAPQGRLPADHRRGQRGDPRRRRQGPRAPGAPGVDPRHRPPDRADGPRRPRPDDLGLHGRRGRAGRRRRRLRRRRAARPVQPPGADRAPTASGSAVTPTSTRPGAPWPPTRSWSPASPASARWPSGSWTARPPAASPTPPRARACSRTWSPCSREKPDGQGQGRRHRDRADQAPGHAGRRLDGRARAGGRRPRPRRRRDDVGGHRRRRRSARRPTSSRAS